MTKIINIIIFVAIMLAMFLCFYGFRKFLLWCLKDELEQRGKNKHQQQQTRCPRIDGNLKPRYRAPEKWNIKYDD